MLLVMLTCLTVYDQELGIKLPLHRKKLQLALQAIGSEEEDNKGKLDYNWVTSEYQLTAQDISQLLKLILFPIAALFTKLDLAVKLSPILCHFILTSSYSQDGWMTLVCLSIRPSLMRGGWMVVCYTTWQWWVFARKMLFLHKPHRSVDVIVTARQPYLFIWLK